MEDALDRYRTASETGDLESLAATLADDVAVVSPVSGRMVFRGRDDALVILGAVYGSLRDLRWLDELGDGSRRVVYGETRIGPVQMTDAMLFDFAPDGRISRISPHLRPWLALTMLAIRLLPTIVLRPRLVLRALRG